MGEGNYLAHLPHAPQKVKILWRVWAYAPQKFIFLGGMPPKVEGIFLPTQVHTSPVVHLF
jgi:hypothetical protein